MIARFPRLARDVATFVVVAVLLLDVLMTGIEWQLGSLAEGRGPLLDVWDAVKAGLAAALMVAVAVRLRAVGAAAFAVVFGLIAFQDQVAWHGRAAAALAERIDFSRLLRLAAVGSEAWGEFLILAVLALLGGVVVWMVPTSSDLLRRARRVLTALLALLFGFAVLADLVSAAAGGWWPMVEETGERFVLSAALGYVSGLLVAAVQIPTSRARRQRR